MGLDIYEVMLEIEEAFKLRFTDAEMQRCNTVGDIYELLLSKTGNGAPLAVCLSRIAFYRLRGQLQSVTGIDRRRLRPNTRLDEIFPREQLHSTWQRLAGAVGVYLPALERDRKIDDLATLTAFAMFVCMLLGFLLTSITPLLGIAIFALMPACALFWAFCIPRQKVAAVGYRLPMGVATVGDLAHAIKWHYYVEAEQAERAAISAAGQATWDKLVGVLCEQMGVKPEEVTLDANLFNLAG
jgi:hypothetical protein